MESEMSKYELENAFRRYIASLPESVRDGIETYSYQNAFADEVYDEYASDEERWQVALATAKMYADIGGVGY
jgi:hypothetical protein